MRVVFCGTPEFAVGSLQALVDDAFEVALVVSQPDKVRGRRGRPEPSPVLARARALGLPDAVLERGRARREELYARILELRPDVVVVVAFGHIVREPLLHGAPYGCVNVHASSLPRWRGPAPIHTAIVAGDRETGVCTMQLAEGVDTGAVYLHEAVGIGEDETAGQLHDRLAAIGAALLPRTLRGLAEGSLRAIAQDEAGATHAPMLDKGEGSVDFDAPARRVHDRIRGFDPWPGVTVVLGDRRLKLASSSSPTLGDHGALPGTVLEIDDARMTIACADGTVRIASVQAEGKRASAPAAYARGHALRVGDRLDPLPGFVARPPRW
jgi:methionyl-tRNA formyltransferase